MAHTAIGVSLDAPERFQVWIFVGQTEFDLFIERGVDLPLQANHVAAASRAKVDDPVGAISVHGVCGAWGTLGAGLFNIGGVTGKIIMVQLVGIGACFVWTFVAAFIMFKLISMTIGLRVSAEEEMEGLDYAEHGGEAYPDFGQVTHSSGTAIGRTSAATAAIATGIPAEQA